MQYSDRRIILFVGGYGSGKTEVAVNFSLFWRRQLPELSIVDLDVVNPYFRSRERQDLFEQQQIKVIAPAGALATADLPALPSEISSAIRDVSRHIVFDVGGDEPGATALGRYSRMLAESTYDMWFVVNACRPFSQAVEPTVGLLRSVERTSRMKVTGLINNTNLMQHTDLPLIERGERLVEGIAEQTGLPVVFNSVVETLSPEAARRLHNPVLPLHLYMKRPWE